MEEREREGREDDVTCEEIGRYGEVRNVGQGGEGKREKGKEIEMK